MRRYRSWRSGRRGRSTGRRRWRAWRRGGTWRGCWRGELAESYRETRLLPDEHLANQIMKYEGHLGRQLTQTLRELERVQSARRGRGGGGAAGGAPCPPPL